MSRGDDGYAGHLNVRGDSNLSQGGQGGLRDRRRPGRDRGEGRMAEPPSGGRAEPPGQRLDVRRGRALAPMIFFPFCIVFFFFFFVASRRPVAGRRTTA